MAGDYKAAGECHEQALAIRKKVLGEKHLHTALSLFNLAEALENGEHAAALKSHQRSLAIYKSLLVENHPFIARGLNQTGRTLQSSRDYVAVLLFRTSVVHSPKIARCEGLGNRPNASEPGIHAAGVRPV